MRCPIRESHVAIGQSSWCGQGHMIYQSMTQDQQQDRKAPGQHQDRKTVKRSEEEEIEKRNEKSEKLEKRCSLYQEFKIKAI